VSHDQSSTIQLLAKATSFAGWVGQAAPQEIFEYHRGFLAMDTDPRVSLLSWQDRGQLERLARQAWEFAEHGLVHLVQRRRAFGEYSYFAIARRRPSPPAHSISSLLLEKAA
jgi:hypothetical protein